MLAVLILSRANGGDCFDGQRVDIVLTGKGWTPFRRAKVDTVLTAKGRHTLTTKGRYTFDGHREDTVATGNSVKRPEDFLGLKAD